jgi:hypothetical protein
MYWIASFLIVSFTIGLVLHWLFRQLNILVGVASQSGGRGILMMSMLSMSSMMFLLMIIDVISPIVQLTYYRIWIHWSFLLTVFFLIINQIFSEDSIYQFKWDYIFNFLISHVISLIVLAVLKLLSMAYYLLIG